MMKIHLERTGGFTGIPLRTFIDSDILDPEENEVLQAMVESTQFFDLPEKILASGNVADRFHYKLTIEKMEQRHTVEVCEAEAPEELQDLIQWIILLARSMRT